MKHDRINFNYVSFESILIIIHEIYMIIVIHPTTCSQHSIVSGFCFFWDALYIYIFFFFGGGGLLVEIFCPMIFVGVNVPVGLPQNLYWDIEIYNLGRTSKTIYISLLLFWSYLILSCICNLVLHC